MDIEVERIKQDQYAELRNGTVIMLLKSSYGYEVRQWLPNGVAPTSAYDTPQEAGARALQLLGLKEPIMPQNWPESVGIGPNPGPPPKDQLRHEKK